MFYSLPTTLSFETGIPYMMAIPDLQHRLQPEFPECLQTGNGNGGNICSATEHAMPHLLLADSEVGKDDILEFLWPLRRHAGPRKDFAVSSGQLSRADGCSRKRAAAGSSDSPSA